MALVGAIVAVVVISSGNEDVSPAEELPPGLREQLVREHLDLDRVRAVECGAGAHAPVDLHSLLDQLVQVPAPGSSLRKRAGEVAPPKVVKLGKICRTELGDGGVTVSVKIGDRWEILPRAQVARAELNR